ncbi:MAG: hypothetical protein M0D55_20250 [Elusimicrobiota bacterium]|nr:MAG: hypothetical protein M0D55_20250 [Elusimicrobiota bacterium]
MFILEAADALEKAAVKFAVAGGYAVALHGAVRGTLDVDIVLAMTKDNFVAAEKALSSLGLSSRLPVNAGEVFSFRKEWLERRNLIAWSFLDPEDPTRVLDIVLTWELKPADVVRMRVAGHDLPVLSKSALVAMKRAAGRPQDLADVDALERP